MILKKLPGLNSFKVFFNILPYFSFWESNLYTSQEDEKAKQGLVSELIDGSKSSSCKRPCLRTKVTPNLLKLFKDNLFLDNWCKN